MNRGEYCPSHIGWEQEMFELKKMGIVRRASAWLLDAILVAVLATGFMFLISLICNYGAQEKLSTKYFNEWEGFRKEYVSEVASYYGFTYKENENGSYEITKDGKPSTLGAVIEKLDESNGEDSGTAEAYAKYKALTPVEKVNAQYQLVYSLLFMMISLGTFLSFLVLEFIIPIILKNGQTVGKKVFGIGVVRYDCVKITNIQLFTRTIVGKYAIDTMFPFMLAFLFFFGGLGVIAIILFVAIIFLNLLALFATKNNTPIHDLIAGTVVVDLNLQIVYNSQEEFIEKKAEEEKRKALEKKDY